MTPHQKRNLSPITQRMAGDMLVRNLAQRTIDTYTYHVERFAKHFGKPLDELGPEEIRNYQLHLVEVKKASWSSYNQVNCCRKTSPLRSGSTRRPSSAPRRSAPSRKWTRSSFRTRAPS